MDLTIREFQAVPSNKDVFANIDGLQQKTFSGTILVAGMTEATHYPNGFVAPGTLLAQYTSGANTGYFAPYVQDHAGGLGLDTVAAIVWDGFNLGGPYPGSYDSTVVAGAILLPKTPVYLWEAKMPGLLLNDGVTAYAPVAGDLTGTNWSFVDLGTTV